MKESTKQIRARIRGRWGKTAYILLPGHPGIVPGCVARSANLADFVPGRIEQRIVLDFDKDDTLIGIEILAPLSTPRPLSK